MVEAAQNVHERAFSRARGAHERHELSLLDRQRDALEHRHVKLADDDRFCKYFEVRLNS